jgi:prepilin-type N-terminal cleavage/methylation domain-containing protein
MSNRKGFTLIELLIVVVIIGILAAIAIPKFAATKEKAYLASMKSDLKNLATAQEAYFADNFVYMAGVASNVGGVGTPLPTGCAAANCLFTPSAGVTITAALGGNPGWTATATHQQTTKTCAIFLGDNVTAPATVEGEPKCL